MRCFNNGLAARFDKPGLARNVRAKTLFAHDLFGKPVPAFPDHAQGPDMTRDEISEFCVASLAKALRVKPDSIDRKVKFSRLGLDSAMIVYVMMELEEKLGIELTTDDFFDHPTVEELSRHLADRRAAAA